MASVAPELREVLSALATGGSFCVVGEQWMGDYTREGHYHMGGGEVHWLTERQARCTNRMVKALKAGGYIDYRKPSIMSNPIYCITEKGRKALEDAPA